MRTETINPNGSGSELLFNHWIFVVRYVVTPVVLLALQTVSLFRN